MKNNIYKIAFLLIITASIISTGKSQVLISGTVGSPDASAMLEIKSDSKGLLIPRLTTENRKLITATPGLLVFDSTIGSFFLYGKTASGSNGWIDLSTDAGIWTRDYSKGNVFLSNSTFNVGIGTSSPKNRLVIQASNDSDTLLEILDKNGVPLMVVTPVLTRFNFVKPKKGVSGGFAVGRYATAKDGKALTDTASLFLVTTDSTRIYTSGSAVTSGGFAVGRYATAKGQTFTEKFFYSDIDSTRVYTNGGSAVTSGGFAVGRYATAKGTKKYNFFTDADSTRVFTGGLSKGVSGGFAVGRYATAKGGNGNYMYMVPDNYFIGHQAGDSLQTGKWSGKYNTFFGYQAGMNDTSGMNNVFIGYNAGIKNTSGYKNILLGNNSGYLNKNGNNNIFIGDSAGYSNISGYNNVFLGVESGANNITGNQNVFLGRSAGHENTTGGKNIIIGTWAGYDNETGEYNVFMGHSAGNQNTTGFHNLYLGTAAGYYNKSGFQNTCLGFRAAAATDSSHLNTVIGAYAAELKDIGNFNTIMGAYAAYSASEAEDNTIIGHHSGEKITGDRNTLIGSWAGANDSIGSENVCVGLSSGRYNNGSFNTIIGPLAGHESTGSYNVFIGLNAGRYSKSSDKLYIENSAADSTQTLIYGEFDNDNLRFNANVGIGGKQDDNYNLTVNDNNSVANMKLYGGGDTYNYSQIVLQSKDTPYEVLWEINQSKDGHKFKLVHNDASGWYTDFVVDTLGNVEVFKKTKTVNFQMTNGASNGYILQSDASGNASWVTQSSLDDNDWTVSGNTMYSAVSGNVGIGTTTPTANLSISASNFAAIALTAEGTDGREYRITSTDDANGIGGGKMVFYDQTGNVARMIINSSGNVGIGTTSPDYKLQVNGDICPETNKGGDLGKDGLAWNDIYYDDMYNQGAAAFTDRNITDEILLYPPKAKVKGMKDYKTERGLIELNPNSLPKDLTGGEFWILTDEMTTYNYKANYDQQLQIKKLEKEIEVLKKQIQELKQLIQNK